jgi:hypothetical protein
MGEVFWTLLVGVNIDVRMIAARRASIARNRRTLVPPPAIQISFYIAAVFRCVRLAGDQITILQGRCASTLCLAHQRAPTFAPAFADASLSHSASLG